MPPPNVPAAKRSGLAVDLARLEAEGDGWLTPEDRYALKTYGVCAQEQDHVFMVRIRIPGGALPTGQARGLARLARKYGDDWLHISTRQNLELHWVEDRRVPELIQEVSRLGLSTRSACGHTMRNVMASEAAGASVDEPFDCLPDARLVSDTILARSATLNCQLPSRVNLSFGGSPRCRDDALLNDGGFVSVVHDGTAGYEVWAGGSLGKSPFLAVKLADFVPRSDVMAAAEALIDVFVAHGEFDNPAKGRLKYAVQTLGADGFRAAWERSFEDARRRDHPQPPEVEVLGETDRVAILTMMPAGGWSSGVRPERSAGFASVTIDAPMGDLYGADVEMFSDLADRCGDGALNLSRDQNVVLRGIPVAAVADIRDTLAERNLFMVGEANVAAVRACTGSAVCALGITKAPDAGQSLLANPGLRRNSSLKIHVSGCPNSCAQHQVGDIGLAGSKVKLGGRTVDGYHVYVGADLHARMVGEVVGRVGAEDVGAAVEAITGIWESLRHNGETMGQTVRRLGLDAFAANIGTMLRDRWATGPEESADASAATEARASRPVATPDQGRWVTAATTDALPPGSCTTVDVDGQAVALVNAGGSICAVADTCPHAGGSLGRGSVEGFSVSCPLHAATFDVRTGEALSGPAIEPVAVYPVRIDHGVIQIGARAAVPASIG